eukprot:scaffold289148_cov26-Tisochrysis_lutea.AAC.4
MGAEPSPGSPRRRAVQRSATWPRLVNLTALPMRFSSMSTSQSRSAVISSSPLAPSGSPTSQIAETAPALCARTSCLSITAIEPSTNSLTRMRTSWSCAVIGLSCSETWWRIVLRSCEMA